MKDSLIYYLNTFWSGIIFLLILILVGTSSFWIQDKTNQTNRQQPVYPLLIGGEKKIYLSRNSSNIWTPIKSWKWTKKGLTYKKIIDRQENTKNDYIVFPKQLNIKQREIWESKHIHNVTHYLGTDVLGRDVFSRMIKGVNISLTIGFLSIIVSLFIGACIGLLAGYFGGWIDKIILLFINSVWSIPTILLVFALVLALGRGMTNIVLAIGLTMWVDVARLVRGMTMKIKNEEYIKSSIALGYQSVRIIIRHILINITEPLIVIGTVNFATAILVEAGISYLGFGIQPPSPSLGQILADNYSYVLGGHWIKSIVPAVAIFILVLLLNLSGNALRDHLDVNLIKRRA